MHVFLGMNLIVLGYQYNGIFYMVESILEGTMVISSFHMTQVVMVIMFYELLIIINKS